MTIPMDKSKACSVQLSNIGLGQSITVKVNSAAVWALYGADGEQGAVLTSATAIPLKLGSIEMNRDTLIFTTPRNTMGKNAVDVAGGYVIPVINFNLYMWAGKSVDKVYLSSMKSTDVSVQFAFEGQPWGDVGEHDTPFDWT